MLLGRKIQLVNERKKVPVDYSSWLQEGERITGLVCTVDQGTATVDTLHINTDGRGVSFYINNGTLGDVFNVVIEADTSFGQRRYDTVNFQVGTNGGATILSGATAAMQSIIGPTGPTGTAGATGPTGNANLIAYTAANWYNPPGIDPGASVTPGAGTIKLIPFLADQSFTINSLAAYVVTGQAASNCQLAIYASDATSHLPTGAPLSNTGSIATTATAAVSAALGANVSLTKGNIYWLAIIGDTAGVVFTASSAGSPAGKMIGDATLTNVVLNQSGYGGLSIAQTFGIWPTFSGATVFTRGSASDVAFMAYKIQSVP